jgi:hypothetical protein
MHRRVIQFTAKARMHKANGGTPLCPCFLGADDSPVEYPTAVALMSNKTVDVKGLITRRFRLADFEMPLQTADDAAEKPVKVLITE